MSVLRSVFFGFLLLVLAACSSIFTSGEPSYQSKIRRLSYYQTDFSSPLASRILPPSGAVLRYLNDLDGRSYKPYHPSSREIIMFQRNQRRLPAHLRSLLAKRIVGIYFIEGFLTSGMTDYVFGSDGLYAFFVFDSAVLKSSMEELLTRKVRTAFRLSNAKESWQIRVPVGRRESALLYILLHEGAHLIDLRERITPYLEPNLQEAQRKYRRSPLAVLSDPYWEDYRRPRKAYDFPLRKKITFYGFRKGPLLEARDILPVYEELSQSPFVSLYGSLSWAEDWAELYALGMLRNRFGIEYKIEIQKRLGSAEKKTYYPLRSSQARQRLRLMFQKF